MLESLKLITTKTAIGKYRKANTTVVHSAKSQGLGDLRGNVEAVVRGTGELEPVMASLGHVNKSNSISCLYNKGKNTAIELLPLRYRN